MSAGAHRPHNVPMSAGAHRPHNVPVLSVLRFVIASPLAPHDQSRKRNLLDRLAVMSKEVVHPG